MKKTPALASTLKARKGSNESFFNQKGEMNASSKSDAIQQIAHLMTEIAANGGVVTEEQASTRESQLKTHREMVQAAFDDPQELAALGDTLGETIRLVTNREGFARRFLSYQEVVDGAIPQWRVNMKSVTANLAVGPVQTNTQFVRDNIIYPDEFYITARPYIEQKDLVRTNADILEEKYVDALEATMVQEDRTWKRMADELVGLDNPHLNIAGKLTPAAFATLVQMVNAWGVTSRYALLASNLWTDIAADESWATIIDPVSQQELLLTGKLGMVHGVEIVSDYFRHPQHKVLEGGEIYVIGDPTMHGGISDRGGVESQPIDITTEKVPGRGWVMTELVSMVIANSRSIARGRRQ